MAPEAGVPVAWANTAGSLRNVPGKAPQNRTKPQQPILLSIFFHAPFYLGGSDICGGRLMNSRKALTLIRFNSRVQVVARASCPFAIFHSRFLRRSPQK